MREILPNAIQERLDSLAQQFRDGLPRRIQEIVALQSRAVQGDVAAARDLLLRVHRLAGTASTFGMDSLNAAAIDAERAIDRDLAQPERLLREDTISALERMRSAASYPYIPLAPDLPTVNAVASDDCPRLVIMAGSVAGLPDEFEEQLAVYGIALVRIDEPSGLVSQIERSLEKTKAGASAGEETQVGAGTTTQCVFMAEVSYLAQNHQRLRDLAEIRKRFPDELLVVLVADEDDFQNRLRSVRFGADVFVSTPLDIGALIDRLEGMLHPDEMDPYHILIVDDDPEQVSDTALILQQAGMITSVVTDPQNIFKVLVEYKPELILMDMYMPGVDGSELAALIRQNENFISVPIVFMSVETDTDRQLAAIRAGADDFLVKPVKPELLVTSVRIRAARTRAMRFFMERDSLTGLLNHTNLKERLEHEMQRSRRIGTELVFAMIDIDKFKGVNDTYGHLTGDRVLKSLARLLTDRLRRTDVVGRYGGEEFGVILFNTSAVHAERILNEIRESFSRIRHNSGTQDFSVTFSCGIAEFPLFETAQEINEAADASLYKAKENGRNQVRCAIVDTTAV